MGSMVVGLSALWITTPTEFELYEPDNFFIRETIETAATTALQVPGIAIGVTGMVLAGEAVNMWGRARNHRRELEAESVV